MSQSQSFMGLAVTQEKSGNMIIDNDSKKIEEKYTTELIKEISKEKKEKKEKTNIWM